MVSGHPDGLPRDEDWVVPCGRGFQESTGGERSPPELWGPGQAFAGPSWGPGGQGSFPAPLGHRVRAAEQGAQRRESKFPDISSSLPWGRPLEKSCRHCLLGTCQKWAKPGVWEMLRAGAGRPGASPRGAQRQAPGAPGGPCSSAGEQGDSDGPCKGLEGVPRERSWS